MKSFSVFNYENLPKEQKIAFNRVLAQKLSPLLNKIKVDDVLDGSAIELFVALSGESRNASKLVSNLYHSISGGIQVGSGNQTLFNDIVSAFSYAWDSLKK